MNFEELKVYAKAFRNGWKDLIVHEEEDVRSICVNGQGAYFNVICNVCVNVDSHTFFYIFIYNITKKIICSPFVINSFVE